MMSNLQTSENTRLSEKSKQCKKILLISFCVFLTGCFGSDEQITVNVQKFKIEDTTFEVSLPETWEILTPNNQKGEVILAQKNDENLVITHQNNYSKDTANMIVKSLEKNFFSFELISANQDSWMFKGKLSAKSPSREFQQKIIQVPNSTQFLYESCSAEIFEGIESDCLSTLESFKISK